MTIIPHPQDKHNPQGAFVTRETVAAPIRLTMWRSGHDLQSVELTAKTAVNLAVDLLLAARQEMKDGD